MTSDEQEALSRCYGNSILMVLPLSSGLWATFNAARQLHSIVPAEELVSTLCHIPPPTSPSPRKTISVDFDLFEELGV